MVVVDNVLLRVLFLGLAVMAVAFLAPWGGISLTPRDGFLLSMAVCTFFAGVWGLDE